MVCIYCYNDTHVYNSRQKTRNPSVWRRRRCNVCVAQFSTLEMPDYASALVVRSMNGKLYPFSRDKLFLSLYNALGHRQDARDVATELTHTVIGSMLRKKTVKDGAISVNDLSTHAYITLKRFDPLAAHTYKAYHKNALSTKTSS